MIMSIPAKAFQATILLLAASSNAVRLRRLCINEGRGGLNWVPGRWPSWPIPKTEQKSNRTFTVCRIIHAFYRWNVEMTQPYMKVIFYRQAVLWNHPRPLKLMPHFPMHKVLPGKSTNCMHVPGKWQNRNCRPPDWLQDTFGHLCIHIKILSNLQDGWQASASIAHQFQIQATGSIGCLTQYSIDWLHKDLLFTHSLACPSKQAFLTRERYSQFNPFHSSIWHPFLTISQALCAHLHLRQASSIVFRQRLSGHAQHCLFRPTPLIKVVLNPVHRAIVFGFRWN